VTTRTSSFGRAAVGFLRVSNWQQYYLSIMTAGEVHS
jgi:hypothetical protein